ncbi:hypothetical protein [Lactobacillus phage P185]|nr:hypothetical protein [Lactobacillus phage P185]
MTIDHLVFNRLKWFNVADNADSVTANGKKYYAVPSKITIKRGTYIEYPIRGSVWADAAHELEKDVEVKCIGANDNHYFFIGSIGYSYTFQEREGYGVGEVSKSNCKNIVW